MRLGGAEKHVISLASGLRERGYATGIACIFQEGRLAEEVRREQIPFECLGIQGRWGAKTLFEIGRWIRSRPIDILHTYLFGFHFFAGFPARFSGVPLILSSRREVPQWQKKRHRWIENLGNFFVDRVICCSEAVRQWTLEKENMPAEKVLTIYNGVNIHQFSLPAGAPEIRREFGIPTDAPLVGTVANFSGEKGYPYLAEAAGEVLKENRNARFLFVGTGPLEKSIKEQVRKIPGQERIIFTGARSDVADLIDAMDVFVLSSVIEGFPNVLLEALALSKPLVATEVGGVPELIHSGEDGVLVPSRDGHALARAILSLLQNPEKARALGLQGREEIRKKFTRERMIDEYEALYLSLQRSRNASFREEGKKDLLVQPVGGN